MANEMRKTTNKSTASEKLDAVQKIDVSDLKKENNFLKSELDNLKTMIANLSLGQAPQQNLTVYSSKMDKPCTLIHFDECMEELPNTIVVNGNVFSFSRFGEKKIFRFQDMQQIVSRYRKLFERGLFMLGEDCQDDYADFGITVTNFPMTADKHQRIAELSLDEFKSVITSLNTNQRVLIAKTWVQRYNEGKPGYDNIDKIKILNKSTDGLLKGFLRDMSLDD